MSKDAKQSQVILRAIADQAVLDAKHFSFYFPIKYNSLKNLKDFELATSLIKNSGNKVDWGNTLVEGEARLK